MKGKFGNRLATWNSVNEMLDDLDEGIVNPTTVVHCRDRKPSARGFVTTTIRFLLENPKKASELEKMYYFSQVAPHELVSLHGEILRNSKGLYLRYSTVKSPMRTAFATSVSEAYNLQSIGLLHKNLCDNSVNWLYELLDTYEDHVVEFTSFSGPVGLVRGFNTLFWEVRKY